MKLSAPVYQLKRRAKLLARKEKLPLHDALDRIAHEEGLARWSLLSSRLKRGPGALLHRLSYGDLLLLAGRPGHGKTLLGLQLLLDAVDEGRKAAFFTLEYTEREAMQRIRSLRGAQRMDDRIEIVTSDDLSADFVVDHLSGSDQGTVAVLDYLQVLDQQRSKPPLADQMRIFRDFARRTGTILGFIAQIDRSFGADGRTMPDLHDIRLPNPIDLSVFSKACFVNEGEIRLQALA